MKPNTVTILLMIVIALLCFLVYNQYKQPAYADYEEQQIQFIDAINDNNRQIAEYNRLLEEKKDTLKIIEKQKTIINIQNRDNQNEIKNTNNIDSLIVLYWKYRASTDSTGK